MGLMNCYREPFLGTALRGFRCVGLANLGVVANTKQIQGAVPKIDRFGARPRSRQLDIGMS